MPFEMVSPDGKQLDFSFLFAGYVNKSPPFVQSVLQQALNWHAVTAFDGYQRGPQDVPLQVFALWNVLQRNQVHYSNIITAFSGVSGRSCLQSGRSIHRPKPSLTTGELC
jgi:hypothetical protein